MVTMQTQLEPDGLDVITPSREIGASPPAEEVWQTVLGFHVGQFNFLLDKNVFCEVTQVAVNALPRVQPWFVGVLNLRGNIVPVLDLHVLLGEQTINPKNRHIFVIDKGRKAVATWIDGYPQMLADYELNAMPTGIPQNLPASVQSSVIGSYKLLHTTWLKLSFEHFFYALYQAQAR